MGHDRYLIRFLYAPRAPQWDSRALYPERIAASLVRFGERLETPPSDTAEDDGEGTACRRVRVCAVSEFLDDLLRLSGARVSVSRGRPRRTFVLLGPPASGKSILTLQAVQLLAERARAGSPILPVYVNMAHFVPGQFELTVSGLERLVGASVLRGCPRYIGPGPTPSPILDEVGLFTQSGAAPRALFVFDGLDEMPVANSAAGEQSARLAALAAFIQSHGDHIFLVTCRLRDYRQLRDYNQDFEIVRYELLGWNARMFNAYLESRRAEFPGEIDKIIGALVRAGASESAGQFAHSPLLAALLFGRAIPKRLTLSSLWRRFVVTRLAAAGASPAQMMRMVRTLSEFACERTRDPTGAHSIEPVALELGCKAGLLAPAVPSPEFTIKPIQHYLAARGLLERIRRDPTKADDLEITHPKLRVTFVMISELAGVDPVFLGYLEHRLRREASTYQLARLFDVVAAGLRPGQLERAPTLHAALVQCMENVLRSGTAGEFDLCIQGLGSAPQVLSLTHERVLDLLLHTILLGTLESRRRLFQLLASHPDVAWPLRRFVLGLVRMFHREARLGVECVHFLDRLAEARGAARWTAAAWLGRGTAWLASAAYVYGAYLIGLRLAHEALAGLAGLVGVPVARFAPPPLVPASLPDAGVRLAFVTGLTLLPWQVLRRSARAQYRFTSPVARGLSLLGATTVGRLALLAPLASVAVLNTISSWVEFVTFGAFVALPLVGLASPWFGRTSDAALATPVSRSKRPRNRGAGRRPPDVPSIQPVVKAAALTFVVLAALALVAVYRAERLALLLAGLGTLLLVLKLHLYDPYRAYCRVVRELEPQLGRAFRRDRSAALDEVFEHIADRGALTVFRKQYVRVLGKVLRWDQELLERFEQVMRTPGLPPELRRLMELGATRKRAELEQETNPRL